VVSKLDIKNSTLVFPISDSPWDKLIYPRGGKSKKTINAYVEAVAIGDQLPPIKIQKVSNYADANEPNEATIVSDGIHSWFTFKEKGSKRLHQQTRNLSGLNRTWQKTSVLARRLSIPGPRISLPGKKQAETPLSHG